MSKAITVIKAEINKDRRWWLGLGLALVGGILGVHFGFVGNPQATAVFGSMFVAGLWLRP